MFIGQFCYSFIWSFWLWDVCPKKSLQRGLLFRFLVSILQSVLSFAFPFSQSLIVCLNGASFSKALDPSLEKEVHWFPSSTAVGADHIAQTGGTNSSHNPSALHWNVLNGIRFAAQQGEHLVQKKIFSFCIAQMRSNKLVKNLLKSHNIWIFFFGNFCQHYHHHNHHYHLSGWNSAIIIIIGNLIYQKRKT